MLFVNYVTNFNKEALKKTLQLAAVYRERVKKGGSGGDKMRKWGTEHKIVNSISNI